jgi:hypothetical protein
MMSSRATGFVKHMASAAYRSLWREGIPQHRHRQLFQISKPAKKTSGLVGLKNMDSLAQANQGRVTLIACAGRSSVLEDVPMAQDLAVITASSRNGQIEGENSDESS